MTARAGGVLVLAGPTASGKTTFAIALAERYGAEIVGADSRQVYRDMPIGTAMPTPAQQAQITHHLVGWLDPYERYSAARFVGDAAAAITSIHARGKRAIVAGGTGFYIRALCGDVTLAAEPDPVIRARVLREAQTHPATILHQWLGARNSQRAAELSEHDSYRIMRALEIDLAGANGSAPAAIPLPTLRAAGFPVVKLALQTDLPQLAARIDQRTEAMLAAGFIDEALRIGVGAAAADAVGYREALAYWNGLFSLAELRTALVRATRRYAKRQLTWFRSEPGITWIERDDFKAADAAVTSIGWTVINSSS